MTRRAYQSEIASGTCEECGSRAVRTYCAECAFYLDRLREFGEAEARDRWGELLDGYELPPAFRESWLGTAVPIAAKGERLAVVIPARQRRWIERRLGRAFDEAGVKIVSVRRGIEILRESRGVAG
jgi:hypothetical protein